MKNLQLIKPTLSALRELIGAHETQLRQTSSCSLYDEGFPIGAVIEIFGFGKTDLLSLFLKEHADFKVAWMEIEITVNPYALFQKGVNLQNLLFIEANKEMQWCLSQVLQSGCFQAVVTHGALFHEKELRRFQLLAEKSHSHFFLLSEKASASWVPSLQLQVSQLSTGLQIQNYKKRGFG